MASCSHLIFSSACMVLVIITCLFSGCTSSQPLQTTTPTIAAVPAEELNTIVIKDFTFNPANLTIKTGTPVTWVNQDGAVHQIDSDSKIPVAFVSDSLAHGASFRFVFTQPGSYTYHCIYHPTMKGAIIVQS